MDLEIRTRGIALDPEWRDRIELLASRLSDRYPEMHRLHVAVKHDAHHQHGAEEIALVAGVRGATLRVDKQEARVRAAVDAAFAALAVELDRRHRDRRELTPRPGPRGRRDVRRSGAAR